MRVIVCGAGEVGFHIARYLAAGDNDVTVIDQSSDLIRKVNDNLDARGIVGFASHPTVLETANANETDMLIAVTQADEVNMVACQIAHSLFQVPRKIARVRSRDYLRPIWADLFSTDHMPIDHIISPEHEVANSIRRRIGVPGVFEIIPLVNDKVRVIGIRCDVNCPIINTPLRQLAALFPTLNITIFGILRGDHVIVTTENDQLLVGDEVYFVTKTDHMNRAMDVFGHVGSKTSRVIILGGGNIGQYLMMDIEQHEPDIKLSLIEHNEAQAQRVALASDRATVLYGEVLDPAILSEANISEADTVVAVTNDDKANIVASLLAKRMGAKRTITLVNENAYDSMIRDLGGDVVVNPRAISVSTILQYVRRGRIRQVHSLGVGFGEIIEADVLDTYLVGTPIKDLGLPPGILIAALVRGEEVILPRGETIIRNDDCVVMFVTTESLKKAEAMLQVRREVF